LTENLGPKTQIRENAAAFVAAAVVIATCLFSHLGALGFVGPDEPRYAWIARAMAQTGDWVTPRLYGAPWFEKPILYYWAAAIGFHLHLPAEWAARLPSAFAALAAALTTAWLGWKHYGAGAARGESIATQPALLAPIIFSTSVAAIGFARAATPDMLFSASIALAMASAAACMRQASLLRSASGPPASTDRVSYVTLALFGAFLGLGVLAKGPAAVILAAGALGAWALVTSNFRTTLRLAHPIAIAAFCVVALPWYLLCAHRNPEFLHVFIFQHNFERYLTPLFQHKQPFWFFGPITLLAVLPWTPFLLPTALECRRILRERSWNNSPAFFFACWAIFPVLFFSLSQSKLPSYILPAIPPLAILLAVSAKYAFERGRVLLATISVAIAITWLALGVAVTKYFLPDPQALLSNGLLLAVLGLTALLSLVFGARRNLKLFIFTSAFAAAIAVEIAGLSLLPSIGPAISARQRGNEIATSAQTKIYTYRLQRSWNYGLAFYAGRPIEEWSPDNPGAASLLTTSQGLVELKKLGRFSGVVNSSERGIRHVKIDAVAP
jgi:4-amino-4-deoxy-L-arabinose transferase-like glycosyltransferase